MLRLPVERSDQFRFHCARARADTRPSQPGMSSPQGPLFLRAQRRCRQLAAIWKLVTLSPVPPTLVASSTRASQNDGDDSQASSPFTTTDSLRRRACAQASVDRDAPTFVLTWGACCAASERGRRGGADVFWQRLCSPHDNSPYFIYFLPALIDSLFL